MNRENQQGFALASLVAVFLGISLVGALSFGIWAFVGMQENKADLDAKIESAASVAVAKAEEVKEAEFAEREKDPFKTYTGSATFGSLSLSYPKTWSIYLEEKTSGTVLDFYGHPNIINGLEKENSFAFRVQIVSSSYDSEAEKIQKLAENDKVTVTSFRPAKVPSELGIRAVGEVINDKQGVMILLPQRDKTFKIWTESTDFIGDFDRVVESLSFVP